MFQFFGQIFRLYFLSNIIFIVVISILRIKQILKWSKQLQQPTWCSRISLRHCVNGQSLGPISHFQQTKLTETKAVGGFQSELGDVKSKGSQETESIEWGREGNHRVLLSVYFRRSSSLYMLSLRGLNKKCGLSGPVTIIILIIRIITMDNGNKNQMRTNDFLKLWTVNFSVRFCVSFRHSN